MRANESQRKEFKLVSVVVIRMGLSCLIQSVSFNH